MYDKVDNDSKSNSDQYTLYETHGKDLPSEHHDVHFDRGNHKPVQEITAQNTQRDPDDRDQHIFPVDILTQLDIIEAQHFQRRKFPSSLADIDIIQIIQKISRRQLREILII